MQRRAAPYVAGGCAPRASCALMAGIAALWALQCVAAPAVLPPAHAAATSAYPQEGSCVAPPTFARQERRAHSAMSAAQPQVHHAAMVAVAVVRHVCWVCVRHQGLRHVVLLCAHQDRPACHRLACAVHRVKPAVQGAAALQATPACRISSACQQAAPCVAVDRFAIRASNVRAGCCVVMWEPRSVEAPAARPPASAKQTGAWCQGRAYVGQG